METVTINLDSRLLKELNKVAKSYNMGLEEFIERHLEDHYGW